MALDVRDQDLDIWTWSFTRETLTRLTFDPAEDEFPVWSPDGQRIAFSSSRDGAASDTSLFWRAADGTGSVERLAEGVSRRIRFNIDVEMFHDDDRCATMRGIYVVWLK